MDILPTLEVCEGRSVRFSSGRHWLPNAQCIAMRVPCPPLVGDPTHPCQTRDPEEPPCHLLSGNPANKWTPYTCMPPLFTQPCDWQIPACSSRSSKCIIGAKMYLVPGSLPIDVTFPNP